jgi:hypothetical protein
VQATIEEIEDYEKTIKEGSERHIKARIKEIDDILKDDYEEHLKARFNDGAPFGADFDIWTCKNCLSFDDWYLEEADEELYEELEALKSVLEIEDD